MADDEWKGAYRPRSEREDDAGDAVAAGDEASAEETPPGRRSSPTLEAMKRAAETDRRLKERMALIRHKALILSGKGGVGKSTVAASLAWELALRDFRVGLLDADLHGPNIPLLMGVEGMTASVLDDAVLPVDVMPNLRLMSIGLLGTDPDSPVIWRGPMKAQALRQLLADVEWGELDWLLVDNPPGTGDEPLTLAQELPEADGAIIVTLPQEVSLLDCRKAITFARALKLRVLGVIENMSGFVCPHCGQRVDIFGAGSGQRMAAQMGVPFLGSIPMAVEVPGLTDTGVPLVGQTAPPAIREAFRSITDRLLVEVPS